jgi:hypothetical protein
MALNQQVLKRISMRREANQLKNAPVEARFLVIYLGPD